MGREGARVAELDCVYRAPHPHPRHAEGLVDLAALGLEPPRRAEVGVVIQEPVCPGWARLEGAELPDLPLESVDPLEPLGLGHLGHDVTFGSHAGSQHPHPVSGLAPSARPRWSSASIAASSTR